MLKARRHPTVRHTCIISQRLRGYQNVITHTFVGDDPYLVSDAVFGVKSSLIAPFETMSEGTAEWRSHFDFRLSAQPAR